MRGKNRCYVCFRKHRFLFDEGFPEDFPNKWKLCCFCFLIARMIVRCGINDEVIAYAKRFIGFRHPFAWGKTPMIVIRRRVKKINKLITVFGRERERKK